MINTAALFFSTLRTEYKKLLREGKGKEGEKKIEKEKKKLTPKALPPVAKKKKNQRC